MGLLLFALYAALLQSSPAKLSATGTRQAQSKSAVTAPDISLLQSAAGSGNASAQYKLAMAYARGDGVPQDADQAFAWCKKAAEQGNADAEAELGMMYRIGAGVDEDRHQAVLWYLAASRQGNANAMFDLGAAYYNGDGVPIDDSLSYAWFVLAKERGNLEASSAVARAESELTKVQLVGGYKQIARLCDDGEYIPVNKAEAASWWLRAAQKGDREAEITVADRFLSGQGVSTDYSQALYWCNQAANHGSAEGDPSGDYCVGYIYQHGLGVPPDPTAARRWYQRAGNNSVPGSIKALAQMDESGEGGSVDLVGAAFLYMQLAVFKSDKDALQQVIRLKSQMNVKQWTEMQKGKNQHPIGFSQYRPDVLRADELRILAQIAEAGEGAKVDFVDAAVFDAALALRNDKDALQQVARLKSKMSRKDWNEVQKRLSQYRIDSRKLTALLQESASSNP